MSYTYVDEEPSVHFSPAELIERQVAEWRGLRAEMVAVTQREPFDYTFKSSQHLLIASEHSERDEASNEDDEYDARGPGSGAGRRWP